MKFWDVKNLKHPLKTCNIHYAVNTISISNYHSRILIGSTKRHGQNYDLSGTLLETFPGERKNMHKSMITSCCWNHDGTSIVTGSVDKTVKLWTSHHD